MKEYLSINMDDYINGKSEEVSTLVECALLEKTSLREILEGKVRRVVLQSDPNVTYVIRGDECLFSYGFNDQGFFLTKENDEDTSDN